LHKPYDSHTIRPAFVTVLWCYDYIAKALKCGDFDAKADDDPNARRTDDVSEMRENGVRQRVAFDRFDATDKIVARPFDGSYSTL
jgi:hypothetical protein